MDNKLRSLHQQLSDIDSRRPRQSIFGVVGIAYRLGNTEIGPIVPATLVYLDFINSPFIAAGDATVEDTIIALHVIKFGVDSIKHLAESDDDQIIDTCADYAKRLDQIDRMVLRKSEIERASFRWFDGTGASLSEGLSIISRLLDDVMSVTKDIGGDVYQIEKSRFDAEWLARYAERCASLFGIPPVESLTRLPMALTISMQVEHGRRTGTIPKRTVGKDKAELICEYVKKHIANR